MKNKMLVLIMAMLLISGVILGGCIADESNEDTQNTEGTSPEPGSFYAEYDPDREIYITAPNAYFDRYYLYSSRGTVSFYVISKKPLDTDRIKVNIECQTPYELTIYEYEDLRATEYSKGITGLHNSTSTFYPFYLYQCVQGMDYEMLKQLKNGTYYTGELEDIPMEERVSYYDYQEFALEEYKLVTSEDIPEFYAYSMSVHFKQDEVLNETIRKMELIIGDQSYDIDIGEVTLVAKDSFVIDYPIIAQGVSLVHAQQLYNDGLGKIPFLYYFTAEEDMVLKELNILDENIEVLELSVTIDGMNLIWDGKSEISVGQGSDVTIDLVYRDQRTNELCYNIVIFAMMLCETEDGEAYMLHEYTLTPMSLNLHELYAIVFDGLDMESYYRDYYYPTLERWRETFLE